MALNVYETLMTKNARLAKFTDNNANFAALFYKIISHCESISREKNIDPRRLVFEAMAKPDGRTIAIFLKW